MKTKLRFLKVFPLAILSAGTVSAQITFSDQTSLFPTATFHSGNGIGVVDMNGDKKDDVVRASGNTTQYVEFQGIANGAFTELSSPSVAIGDPWGMCVGDVNNDGFNDVLWGDYGATRILTWNGTNYTSTNITSTTSAGFIFVQGCNFADINGDGNLDAFVCNDVAKSHIYIGNGANGWTYNNSIEMPLATVPSSDNSGNYASIWTDVNNDGFMDLMITHCRQGVNNPTDARRIDQVFINNGDYTYTQDVTNWTGLRDGAQGWSTAWGDIDNDGDQDAFVLNYDVNSKLMINNGSGVFTDAMAGSGIPTTTTFFGENATFHDFDNDGYLDLLISGDNHFLYHNNGNHTFTAVSTPFPYANNTITAHAVGDLNGDGLLDVYASYCDIYNTASSRLDKLWMNTTITSNHYIVFDLVGGAQAGMSNKNGIGAIVKIYGSWGVQVREIRGGEAYGIQNTLAAHFGIGASNVVDSVVVAWPSGIVDVIYGPAVDQHTTINEGAFPTSTATMANHPFKMIVGPNPMNDQVTVSMFNFGAVGLQNMTLEMYDVTGKVVYSQNGLTTNVVVIDRGTLTSGMYFVKVSTQSGVLSTEKLLVH